MVRGFGSKCGATVLIRQRVTKSGATYASATRTTTTYAFLVPAVLR